MKFAKYLEENCIPEWKAAYFDYKKGKKLIKKAEALRSSSTAFQRRRTREESPSTTPLVKRTSGRSDGSYGTISREGKDQADRNAVADHSRRSQDDLSASSSRIDPAVPPPLAHPSSPSMSQRRGQLRKISTWILGDNDIHDEGRFELRAEEESDKAFHQFMEQQIRKVDDFYTARENEAAKRIGELKSQLQEMKDRKKLLSSRETSAILENRHRMTYPHNLYSNIKSFFSYADVDLLNNHPISDDPKEESATQLLLSYRVARRRLRIAIQEFYHSLELLQSYRSLNRTALTKVLKKYDKNLKAKTGPRYVQEYDKTNIGSSTYLDEIMHRCEDVYSKYYYGGDRKHATVALRTKEKTEDYRFTMLRIGIYAGLGIALALEGLVRSQTTFPDSEQKSYLLQVWAAFFFLILMSILFGVNCYIWTRYKINYVFIFEYNVRHNLNWIQYLEIPVFTFFLFSLLFWMCFSNFIPSFTVWYPLLFVCIIAAALFLPLRIFHLSTRRWFINAHGRLLISGISSVRFQDVFLGDLYNSLTYSVGNTALFFCIYRFNWQNPAQCGSSHSTILGFFTALPGIFRLLQCFRRYYDTKHYFPHLVNALKYTMTILQYTTLSLLRIHGNERFLILYIIFGTLNAIFTSVWDIVMDVSLLQPGAKPKFLRTNRGFKQTWVYYAFLVLDPILRFSWIFHIIKGELNHSASLSFYIALAECFRRTLWSTFRVENEHIANVLTYRASRELPLPYAIHTPADLERQKRRTGDLSKTRNEQPRIAEAHATDFERKNLEDLHMDDVNVDSDNSDAEPPSGGNTPADSGTEGNYTDRE